MDPRPLHELQRELRLLIADVLGDHDAAAVASDAARLGIRSDQRLSATARIRIYAEMYFLRMRDTLAADFPALCRALGDAAFAELTRQYAAMHASDRPSLRDLGRHLPEFVAARPELLTQPWQAELARLEWAMVEAFDAADQTVLRREHLDVLPGEAWPDLVLEPVRSLALLHCAAPVDVLREHLLDGDDTTALALEPVRLRVWRQDMTVFHRRIDPTEAAALRRLAGGRSFAELCSELDADSDAEDAATTALRLLARWLEDGVLVAR